MSLSTSAYVRLVRARSVRSAVIVAGGLGASEVSGTDARGLAMHRDGSRRGRAPHDFGSVAFQACLFI
jgi:hypothetical protein